MIWDAIEEGFTMESFPFSLFPSNSDVHQTDYVYRTKVYYKILGSIENDDSLKLEPHIEAYLDAINDPEQLKGGYQKMEEWKSRFLENKDNFEDFINSLNKDETWVEETVLKFETIYASFLSKCLFLTKYKLITVRSIEFNKLRYLEEKTPFAHQTISLHAAFGDLKTSLIGRDKPTDNYCLLLTQGDGNDQIHNILNLSPFYLDRSSFLGKGDDNYPTLFALDYVDGESSDRKYYYKYVDIDVNHAYRFEEDNTFIIDINGGILPEHLEVDRAVNLKFRQIHSQLKLLEVEVPHSDKKA